MIAAFHCIAISVFINPTSLPSTSQHLCYLLFFSLSQASILPEESAEEEDKQSTRKAKEGGGGDILEIGWLVQGTINLLKDKNQMMQMEKLVKQCDMELMKMAVLKHEETFRQQVHELHRLYRIQKQLMSDLTRPSELTCRRQRRKQPRRGLNLQLPADEYIVIGAGDGREATPPSRDNELELTLAVGGSASRRKRREATPDCSGGSLTPSSSTDSDGGLRPVPYHQRAMAFDVQEGMMMKQPPWLVQCLSLRMA